MVGSFFSQTRADVRRLFGSLESGVNNTHTLDGRSQTLESYSTVFRLLYLGTDY